MALLLARTPFRLRAPLIRACRTQHTLHGPAQPLANSPPVVRPTLPGPSATAHAPQTAGPKPPPPTPTRAKPTLKGSKAALTLVSYIIHPISPVGLTKMPDLVPRRRSAVAAAHHWAHATAHPDWGTEQGMRWDVVPSRVRGETWAIR
jgi:hypothetical protein